MHEFTEILNTIAKDDPTILGLYLLSFSNLKLPRNRKKELRQSYHS
jgi:hypothetical protein